MFQTLKQLFAPTNKDLRKRIGFTLVALMIFVIGTSIRVPGTPEITSNLGFLDLINVMGGGSLRNFSIFALGVMPYISASIIMQLLQLDIIPYFSELNKQGPVGRQKINQITRYMGIIFAFIEGFAFSFAFFDAPSAIDHLYIATILTAGTAFVSPDDFNNVKDWSEKFKYSREYAPGIEVSNDNDNGGTRYEDRLNRINTCLFGYEYPSDKLPSFMQMEDLFPLRYDTSTHHLMMTNPSYSTDGTPESHWENLFTKDDGRAYNLKVGELFANALNL